MNDRPIVLVFSRYYLPGHKGGGPIRSVSNLVEQLSNYFDFRIVTSDRDIGEKKPYTNIQNGNWQSVGKAKVLYLRANVLAYRQIATVINEVHHQLVYLNSFFDPVFTTLPLAVKRMKKGCVSPILLAPRGEFSPGALGIHFWRKAIYIRMACLTSIPRSLNWHASSDREADDIINTLGEAMPKDCGGNIRVAVNIATSLPESGKDVDICDRASGGPVRICFLSRITSSKNLDYALRVLLELAVSVDFDIYGNIEDKSYWRRCERLIRKMPDNVRVTYKGCIPHEQIMATLRRYQLFFFPTRGENFGHVIHEALQSGLPVLTSDQTPWKDLQEYGAGWSLSLSDKNGFVQVIENVAEWTSDRFTDASRNANALARKVGMDASAKQANVSMFNQVLDQ